MQVEEEDYVVVQEFSKIVAHREAEHHVQAILYKETSVVNRLVSIWNSSTIKRDRERRKT